LSNLIIVESPAKAKTIEKYLGKSYRVVASVGHIRDLPKSKLGVDVKHDFTPQYENKKEKKEVITELKKKAKKAKNIYLATDPDREGEAISWHLAHILGLDVNQPIRVTFNEITKSGIEFGMSNPRGLDMDLVNAQQARRILDRLVGYKLSPFLWKKVRKGLSAGRVQSVAVRIIVEREKEIMAFVPQEYWSIDAQLSVKGERKTFYAKLAQIDGNKAELENETQAHEVLARFEGAEFTVDGVKKSIRKKQPAPPFITSTLQQEASKKLSFNSRRAMKAAQELYEGVELPEHGLIGLITYMRTDSTRISDEAKAEAKQIITNRYGEEYLPKKPREFKSKKGSQDGHEAIRPSVASITPDDIKQSVSADQYKLYKLIWERFMASQMADALLDTMSVSIKADNCIFKASGYTVRFDGFTRLYEEIIESEGQEKEQKVALPALSKDVKLKTNAVKANQHFTQPPPRYTEASLIKALEENGIGRPSTYAPTISTILDRHYVERQQKQLLPTPLGDVITDLLKDHFNRIVDTKFTAGMEQELDSVEEGNTQWVDVLHKFYEDFEQTLSKAESDMEGKRVKVPDEVTDIECELCGKHMLIKIGRFGKFMGCSGFPDCRNTKQLIAETGGFCPKCGKKMLAKKSKKGRPFFGCEDFKSCNFMTWDTPIADKCPLCGNYLFQKAGKKICCHKEGCEFEK